MKKTITVLSVLLAVSLTIIFFQLKQVDGNTVAKEKTQLIGKDVANVQKNIAQIIPKRTTEITFRNFYKEDSDTSCKE